MGSFFQSPQEGGATSLFNQAMGGSSIFDSLIGKQTGLAKTGLEAEGSRLSASSGADIMSQLASGGVNPGSAGAADLVAKNKAGIGESVLSSEGKVDQNALMQQLQALMQQLQMGYSGLSQSSPFGDLLAGLQTGANIFSGVAKGGSKTQGMNWWG